jgi:hypothetical protein
MLALDDCFIRAVRKRTRINPRVAARREYFQTRAPLRLKQIADKLFKIKTG